MRREDGLGDVAEVGLDALRGVQQRRQQRRGGRRPWSARLAWAETLTAATTRPPASRTGAAIERRPSSSSWSTSAQPCSRTRSSSARSSSALSIARGGERADLGPLEVGVELVVGSAASRTRPIEVA